MSKVEVHGTPPQILHAHCDEITVPHRVGLLIPRLRGSLSNIVKSHRTKGRWVGAGSQDVLIEQGIVDNASVDQLEPVPCGECRDEKELPVAVKDMNANPGHVRAAPAGIALQEHPLCILCVERLYPPGLQSAHPPGCYAAQVFSPQGRYIGPKSLKIISAETAEVLAYVAPKPGRKRFII
jgi:hypothetical protein